MPSTLDKARKHITKKKGADATGALHQFSRDSKRLQNAQIRDERLEKLAKSRKKRDKPLRMSDLRHVFYLYGDANTLAQSSGWLSSKR